MTLHWWMHWFWVTAQFLVIFGNPLPSTTSNPVNQSQSSPRVTSDSTIEVENIYRTSKSTRPTFRIAKAIGLYPQTNTAVVPDRQQSVTTIASLLLERGGTVSETSVHETVELSFRSNISNVEPLGTTIPQRVAENVERIRNSTKKDSKITWILTTNKSSGKPKYDQEERNQSSVARNVSFEEVEDLTVLPLQEEMSKVDLTLNRTRSSFVTSLSSTGAASNAAIRTFNQSEDEVEIDEEVAQTQHFATAASILGVGESTRLSRARNTFIPQHFQRDQVQGDNQPSDYNETGNNSESTEQGSTSAAGIAAITGSCLATVALLSTMGSLGFIIYRRKYLNPPQTLNSDKCSNPDSSGYIDDSTIRDNSEEMYSLDNDSFLNSLEAMTIQNYWTDSVKHTKL
ncbi:PREDICTED: uncharacterized protein LOC108763776 [Trachymyrmex cornetzi]|uniref:uncharacterized protein LOC108763776 n=1 Tax=Trachymyrmex cornetzi TaxID=471704 RepID=UPI00084EE0E3|nr:PREDICTED: uncharacterized protein LOC108763776 [Trachymyrmex cornetzi]